MRSFCFGVLLSGTVLLAGCSIEDYNVVIKNAGGRTIRQAHVSYGEFESIGGIVSPGKWKIHGRPDYPIPKTATVEWQTLDKETHRVEVDVKRGMPKGFRGDIVFEIHDDNTVAIRFVEQKALFY